MPNVLSLKMNNGCWDGAKKSVLWCAINNRPQTHNNRLLALGVHHLLWDTYTMSLRHRCYLPLWVLLLL